MRGNSRRVVVGFDLHQDMHIFLMVGVLVRARVREITASVRTDDNGSVIFIGRQNIVVVTLVGVFNHLEQGFILILAVDGPAGVKDFVAAVLGVRLGEHHQLNVGRVATQLIKIFDQIIDLIVGQCQTEIFIGFHQRFTATGQNIHGSQRRRLGMREECFGRGRVIQHGFGHAVM